METGKKDNQKKTCKNAQYKVSIVLELLRGEPMEHLARREKLSLSELSSWRDTFLSNGKQGFKRQVDKSARELIIARSVIADQAMEIALYKKKAKLLGLPPEE